MVRFEPLGGRTSHARTRHALAGAAAAIALSGTGHAWGATWVTPAQSFSYQEVLRLGNADFDEEPFFQTQTIIFGQTPTLLFAGFDPALGQLQGVRILLDSTQTVTGGVSVAVPLGASSVIASTSPSYTSRLAIWGAPFAASSAGVISEREFAPTCYAPREACLDKVTHSRDFDADLDTTNLPLFLGPDVQVELDYLLSVPVSLTRIAPTATVTYFTQFDWNGTVQLAYDYTPTATVPEPASWALMILGFGAAGAALRRRRRGAAVRRMIPRAS